MKQKLSSSLLATGQNYKPFKFTAMNTVNRNFLPEYMECLIHSENVNDRHINGEAHKPDTTLTECNFGGLMIKLISDEAVICWRDWSGDEVTAPEICEIIEQPDQYSDNLEEFTPCFNFAGNQYQLNKFMKTKF